MNSFNIKYLRECFWSFNFLFGFDIFMDFWVNAIYSHFHTWSNKWRFVIMMASLIK